MSGLEMEKARVRIVVSGIVQGVGYRSFALRHGNSLNLSGYVRNTPEGEVELEAEGDRGDVERFIFLLREGPRAAQVRDVRVEWKEHIGEARGFRVAF
jgi:acylphosphatase